MIAPQETLGQVTFTLQDNIPSGNQYALQNGNDYSPFFTINNPNIAPNSTNSTATIIPATPLGVASEASHNEVVLISVVAIVVVALSLVA